MRYTKWQLNQRIENSFRSSLNTLVKVFIKIAKSSSGDKKRYSEAMEDFANSDSFKRFCYRISKRMVTASFNVDAKTWREAARKSTRSRFIYRMLMENLSKGLKPSIDSQINRNAYIISTLPINVSKEVVKEVEKLTFEGIRAKEVAKIISDKTNQYTKAKAGLIARTEVSKTQTALTRSRSENIGVRWYVWRTSEDAAVRDSHRVMDNVICNWNDAPAPELLANVTPPRNNVHYHAGEIYNCRCYPEPLLDIDDVRWPHKVHINGTIKIMRKEEFSKLF